MPRKFAYTDFPALQSATFDHISAHIGCEHDRHDNLTVRVILRGWSFKRDGKTITHPDRTVECVVPALVFPATASRPRLTLFATIDYPEEENLTFTLMSEDGEELEEWEVSIGIIDPYMVCRFDLPNRPYRTRSEPGSPHTILRLPPEYLQEGVDPRAVPLYDDVLCVLRRHLAG